MGGMSGMGGSMGGAAPMGSMGGAAPMGGMGAPMGMGAARPAAPAGMGMPTLAPPPKPAGAIGAD
eukprot:3054688-Prymnesium_polylepis.1